MPTQLLSELFARASALSDDEQDRLAARVLWELCDDADWEEAFASSLAVLNRLGDAALADHRARKTELLDPDTL